MLTSTTISARATKVWCPTKPGKKQRWSFRPYLRQAGSSGSLTHYSMEKVSKFTSDSWKPSTSLASFFFPKCFCWFTCPVTTEQIRRLLMARIPWRKTATQTSKNLREGSGCSTLAKSLSSACSKKKSTKNTRTQSTFRRLRQLGVGTSSETRNSVQLRMIKPNGEPFALMATLMMQCPAARALKLSFE